MESPCPRCGTIKTESVHHGFLYASLWKMGYHLRRCSFCYRKRMFKRQNPTRPHPDDLTMEDLQRSFDRKIAQSMGKQSEVSKRNGGNDASDSSDEFHSREVREGSSSVGVAEVGPETEGHGVCIKCGNNYYRRSRRRWYEKLLKRPRMARCLKCDHRFPCPR
jgi:hypothetical protein